MTGYVDRVLALATTLDSTLDRLTGATILVAGIVVLARRRTPVVGMLLVAAGLSWLLPVVTIGPFSTLFVHRPLLAAAVVIATEPFWRNAATLTPLLTLGVVSAVPAWSQRSLVLLVAWGAVIARTAIVSWASPRRTRVAPALVAQAVMLAVATFGRRLDLLTFDERRLIYFAATIALVALTVRVVTAPVLPEAVLDDERGWSAWAIGLRAPGTDEFITVDGQSVATLRFRRAIEVDVGALGTAMLVHDDPAFADPAVQPRLRRAIRMMSERIALVNQINAQRADVEASRRRLLNAEHAATLALQGDLARDVQPHLDAIDRTLHELDLREGPAVQLLTDVRHEVDELASGSVPAELAAGLDTALRALADRTVIPTSADLEPIDVDELGAVALYMIASEATTNAVKHSGAARVEIALGVEHGVIALRVADNGDGGALTRPGGGLDHAARRLGELGGWLTVDSPAQQGTVVVARLPLHRG